MVTGAGSDGRDDGLNLQTAADRWNMASARPTPTANDHKGSGPTMERADGKMRGDRLDYATEQVWQTPAVADVQGGRKTRSGGRGTELLLNGQAAELADWMTPRVTTGGYTRDRGRIGAERLTLEGQAKAQWATPTSLSYGESHQPGNSHSYNANMALANSLSGRLDPATSTDGADTSPSGRKLNPLFVCSLMGWPDGWTTPPAPGSTSFGCSETAWSRWWLAMRSELFSIALQDAPNAQPDLFA